MLQIRENSIMSQHPVIFIGSLRCHAAALSVVSLDREKVKNRHAGGENRDRYEHLQEHRSALITAPVPGKIDMREKAAL